MKKLGFIEDNGKFNWWGTIALLIIVVATIASFMGDHSWWSVFVVWLIWGAWKYRKETE